MNHQHAGLRGQNRSAFAGAAGLVAGPGVNIEDTLQVKLIAVLTAPETRALVTINALPVTQTLVTVGRIKVGRALVASRARPVICACDTVGWFKVSRAIVASRAHPVIYTAARRLIVFHVAAATLIGAILGNSFGIVTGVEPTYIGVLPDLRRTGFVELGSAVATSYAALAVGAAALASFDYRGYHTTIVEPRQLVVGAITRNLRIGDLARTFVAATAKQKTDAC